MNKLLFKAYNAEATPKAISPFIVRVYSPEAVRQEFFTIANKNLTVSSPAQGGRKAIEGVSISNMQFTFHDVDYEMINAYALPPKGKPIKANYHANLNDWQKFKRNVEKLVA